VTAAVSLQEQQVQCVACFTGQAVPQAPGSWVRPAESRVVSQYDCAPPVKPQKKCSAYIAAARMAAVLKDGSTQSALYISLQFCCTSVNPKALVQKRLGSSH
jgi:hypothetical protein